MTTPCRLPLPLPCLRLQVREEQERLRPDPSKQIDGEVLGEMQYTRQVVKELLRYRAPAPMVPQVGGRVAGWWVGGWVGRSVLCQGICH